MEAANDRFRGLCLFRQDVEENAGALRAEQKAAGVGIEFNGEMDTGLGEGLLERQGLAQFFGDKDEVEFGIAEEFRFLAHGIRTCGRRLRLWRRGLSGQTRRGILRRRIRD